MIPIANLILPAHRDQTIHIPTYLKLQSIPVEEWYPITVKGRYVHDGLQRVLAARRLGYTEIPGKQVSTT